MTTSFFAPRPLVLRHLEDRVDALFLGRVDERAGVDDDDVGVVGRVDQRVAGGLDLAEHQLGVDLVLRTTERHEVDALTQRHRARQSGPCSGACQRRRRRPQRRGIMDLGPVAGPASSRIASAACDLLGVLGAVESGEQRRQQRRRVECGVEPRSARAAPTRSDGISSCLISIGRAVGSWSSRERRRGERVEARSVSSASSAGRDVGAAGDAERDRRARTARRRSPCRRRASRRATLIALGRRRTRAARRRRGGAARRRGSRSSVGTAALVAEQREQARGLGAHVATPAGGRGDRERIAAALVAARERARTRSRASRRRWSRVPSAATSSAIASAIAGAGERGGGDALDPRRLCLQEVLQRGARAPDRIDRRRRRDRGGRRIDRGRDRGARRGQATVQRSARRRARRSGSDTRGSRPRRPGRPGARSAAADCALARPARSSTTPARGSARRTASTCRGCRRSGCPAWPCSP